MERTEATVITISAHGLARCRTATATIVVINPGAPSHVLEAGRGWILNWVPGP